MKHVLYGTTALVAAGVLASPAFAADGVKLGVGGYYLGAAGGVISEDFNGDAFTDEGDVRNHVFKQDIEIHFKGEVVLDNGLTVGARVELEGQSVSSGRADTGNPTSQGKPFDGTDRRDDQIDAAFAYLRGGFGEFRFGDTSEAGAQMCYLVPSAAGMFGADSPFFNFSNAGINGFSGTNGTCYGLEGAVGNGHDKATKALWFSPNWAGFSLAASYTPEQTEDSRNTTFGAGTRFDNNNSQVQNAFSVAAQFAHDFNGFNLVVGGAGSWGDWERTNAGGFGDGEDPAWYNAYAQVAFSGFTIGGAFSYAGNYASYTDADYYVYGAGVTYNFDAWTVGVGWTHGEYEAPDTTYSGSAILGDNDEQDIIQATASYALGPGITIDAMAGWVNYDDATTSAGADDVADDGATRRAEYDAFELGIGLGIRF
jgi:hypothetical protein